MDDDQCDLKVRIKDLEGVQAVKSLAIVPADHTNYHRGLLLGVVYGSCYSLDCPLTFFYETPP